ncbi:hypothetical protein [Olivibacter sitiensis]|uniref:hypothetical protein n=1 Tax=Olivibacter sitiensis TaxID=376470 RepID=UPI0003FFA735|nr:hypothetical protein [Olivibacter sitiensis]
MDRVFRAWVPRQLDLWILLLMSVMLSFNNGIPTGISLYVLSDQAGIPADISMASYAYYTGMSCAIPLVFRMNSFTSSKRLLIAVYLILLFLNFVLANTTAPISAVMAAFIVGFIKIFGSARLLGELMPMIMPNGERYEMYCVYYPIAIVVPALSSLVAAYLADYIQWEMNFHFQNLLLFISLLIAILFMHEEDHQKRVPLYQYDWLGTVLLAAGLLLTAYFTTYGLTEDWFHSPYIILGAVCAVITILLFLHRNIRIKRKLFDFEVFKSRALPITLGTLFLLGIFYSSSSLITSLLGIIVPGNPVKNAEINSYVIWGYLIGSVLTYLYFRKTKDCRYIFAFSCLCYQICNVWLFFLINPQTDPDLLFLPLFFRGMGLIISYITAGVYLGGNVPMKSFFPSVTFLIFVRSYLVPIVWSNLINNWYYHRQVINMNYLANGMDQSDALVVLRGVSLPRAIQTQASLLALRDIFGMLNIIGLILLLIIFFFPYHSSPIRRIINWRNKARYKELIQALPA